MIDFTKSKVGDVVSVHCCDSCATAGKIKIKKPFDSRDASWYCEVCGHYGMGSSVDCEIISWLRLKPLKLTNEPVK